MAGCVIVVANIMLTALLLIFGLLAFIGDGSDGWWR